jgi:hypothetical protein
VNSGNVPDVIVIVLGGTEGSIICTIEVVVPLMAVATVVVKAGIVPEVIVTVGGGMDGSTT